jgi:hypothetical protein
MIRRADSADSTTLPAQDLFAVEVAAVGYGIEAHHTQRRLRLLSHIRELRPVGPDVGHCLVSTATWTL